MSTRRIRVLFVALATLCLAAAALAGDAQDGKRLPAGIETVTGTLTVMVEDDFVNSASRTIFSLATSDGETLRLDLGERGEPLRTGLRVQATGRRSGDVFRVDRIERLDTRDTKAIESAWTTGPKKVLVILLNWQDDTAQPYTVAGAQATMFGAAGSVAKFYSENSLNATTMSGDVAGYYTATVNKPTTCDISTVQTQSEAAAAANGYVLSNYQLKVYAFNHIGACGWAGLAYVGSAGAWVNQALSVYVTAHELGHNYGLLHAHSYNCGAVSIGTSCTRSEYGDPFDDMGSGTRHFNSYSKWYLGWIASGGVVTVPIGSSGNYTLSPMENAGGVRGLQILTDAGRTLWLEYRYPVGFDSGLNLHGALVHIGPSSASGTDLLDMTPGDGNFGNAALGVGSSFTDPYASLQITTMAESGGNLDVNLLWGVTPPTAGFTFSPAAPKVGQGVTFTNTSSGMPTGFVWDFGDGTTSTAKNPTHNFSGTGTFTVSLTASNTLGSGSTSKPVPVTAGTALKFYSVAPCRVIDTRSPASPIAAGTQRWVQVAGRCGVPATAVAVAVNVAVTRPSAGGDISFFAGTSTVNFKTNQTRANNAVLPLTSTYYLIAKAEMASGQVDLVVDVNGYYQ